MGFHLFRLTKLLKQCQTLTGLGRWDGGESQECDGIGNRDEWKNVLQVFKNYQEKNISNFVIFFDNQWKKYMGDRAELAPEMPKRAPENHKRAPKNLHRVQCKTN